MKYETSSQSVLVSLPVHLIEALLTLRSALDENLASTLEKAVVDTVASSAAVSERPPAAAFPSEHGRYAAEFRGRTFREDTLFGVFGRIVDMLANDEPEAIVSLSAYRTRRRRLVSRERGGIHIYRRDFADTKTIQTNSGWWIDTNISEKQLKSALKVLCDKAGLIYGVDLRFPR
jgi:hypothetical protein